MSIKQFNREFNVAAKLILKASEKTVQDTASELFTAIIQDTPVDTGQLRGNWQTSIGSPSNSDLRGTLDPSGSTAISTAKSVVETFTLNKDTDIFMTNNLDYAQSIEFGHRPSLAPQGMVRVNVVKFETIVDNQAKKNRK